MNAWLILLASALSGGFEEDFEKDFTGATMRLDFFHSGTSEEEHVSAEELRVEGAWPGSRTQLIDGTDLGKYLFEIRDEASGRPLFSRGFASIYGEWETTGEADYLGNPLTEEYILGGITYQVFERGGLAWKKSKDPWFVPLGEQLAKRYQLDTAPQAQGDIPTYDEALFIPPDPQPRGGTGGEHWIEINLSAQYLIAWEGDVAVNETYVSTGREGFDTPAGTFFINTKLESDDMEGVLGGEYYNVPAVPWVMYFTDVGHAIHGTYWHSNFGYPMSHGCVNLPMDFAEWLYYWADYGTRVEIHY